MENLKRNTIYEYPNEIPLNTLKVWREFILSTSKFAYTGWTGAAKEPYRHWAYYPELEGIYLSIFNCLNESFKDEGFALKPERVIVNMFDHGDSSWLHRDCEAGSNSWTALLFMNEHWDLNWGGDFIIADGTEIVYATAPIPGKFILFDGTMMHAARPVSREAPYPRMGLAIQCINSSKI